MQQFEGKRWGPLHPEHLDYEHAEVLLIGAHTDMGHEQKDQELASLKKDEQRRAHRIGEDDVVFKDLRLRHDEFKKNLDFVGTWS